MKKFTVKHNQHVFKGLTKTPIANYIAMCLKENSDVAHIFIIEPEVENVDLFEKIEFLPNSIRKIIDSFQEGDGSEACKDLKKALNSVGYDFEYGLDFLPFNLHKI